MDVTLQRRDLLRRSAAAAVTTALTQSFSKAAVTASKHGMPGPYPGRVIAVDHPGCIVSNAYQAEPIRQMMRKGMVELTQAPSWHDAWRTLFQKGDVVGIKVSPVGGPDLSSDGLVLREILAGLQEAGVTSGNVIVYSRYKKEIVTAGIDKWLPPGVRWDAPSEDYSEVQHDMGGYDENHFMEMALVKPGEDLDDPHMRRSYVSRIVTRQVNKIINLPVLKHHQSAGVTICLKNLSHGNVNNVNRSHITGTLNACGIFIPSVVSLPVIRNKSVLQICDAVKAGYHGGPGGASRFMWEHKTLYFGTDPVALDKTGLKVLDAKRQEVGMAPIALSRPDNASHFLNCQVEHIEIAGSLGLGVFDDAKIDLKKFSLA
jgi:hypothetical protein